MLIRNGKTTKEKSSRIGVKNLSELGGISGEFNSARIAYSTNKPKKKLKQHKRSNMSWFVYKGKVVATYTFIYAQKLWGLLPF